MTTFLTQFKTLARNMQRHVFLGTNDLRSIWITSPAGKHYTVPLKIGLRIIRKRYWSLARVEPVKTRWQHFLSSLNSGWGKQP